MRKTVQVCPAKNHDARPPNRFADNTYVYTAARVLETIKPILIMGGKFALAKEIPSEVITEPEPFCADNAKIQFG